MTRSAAIAAAYMLAVSRGGAMLRDDKAFGPADYLPPSHTSHDAERIAKTEAKRARDYYKQMNAYLLAKLENPRNVR